MWEEGEEVQAATAAEAAEAAAKAASAMRAGASGWAVETAAEEASVVLVAAWAELVAVADVGDRRGHAPQALLGWLALPAGGHPAVPAAASREERHDAGLSSS